MRLKYSSPGARAVPSRRITTLTLIGAIVIAGVVGYLVVPTAFNQNKPTSVKVGETFASTSTAYLQAGIQNGYFAKYGLNVSTVRFSSETLMVAALLKGDVQLAIGTAADVMFFDAAGGNARIIATYTQREVFSIVAPVNLTSARSLVGRVATVSTTAGTDYLAIALYLNASGVSPSARQYIPGGFSAPARLGMVEKGEAQVVAIIPAYLSLLKGIDLHVRVYAAAVPEHVAW